MVAKCSPSWRIGVCAEVGSAEFRTPLYIILAIYTLAVGAHTLMHIHRHMYTDTHTQTQTHTHNTKVDGIQESLRKELAVVNRQYYRVLCIKDFVCLIILLQQHMQLSAHLD